MIAKAVPSAPVIVKPTTSAQAWNTVDPKSGDLYLQLAALGTNSTNEYLKTLNAKGIHPHIAPGPSEGLHRILIGPYADKAALKKELQALRTSGIETFVRAY